MRLCAIVPVLVLSLSPQMKRRLERGEWPAIFSQEKPEPNHSVRVTEGLTLVVAGSVLAKGKGWAVKYHLVDMRPRLLKDSPYGGYTKVPGFALRGEPEAVSEEYEEKLVAEAHAIATLRESSKVEATGAADDVVEWLDRTLKECRAKGIDTTSVEFITRNQISRLQKRLLRLADAAAAA